MANHELFLLHLGRLGWLDETGEKRYGQVPGYLIRSAGGQTILVDTGNPGALIGRETAEPWSPLLNETGLEDGLEARLAELGLYRKDIDLLISTHFDFDHCGRHDLFGGMGIRCLVQQSHLEEAQSNPRFDPVLWRISGIDYEAVEGDVDIEPGLTLLGTPGHAVGHQSLLVETAAGPVLLAVDAIALAEHATGDPAGFGPWYPDPAAAARSRDRLLALAAEREATLLFGHDERQWETLAKSPAPFRTPGDG